ncbi:RING finger protein 11 [Takifugu flavidus]|uniref:RING finger protein 11 n=1 Tax=Takifugu flavidus TaxID=433684 RepID=A0A5C6MS26_9TELE|nr:RING finger protein 11 [Takifugu flavidus]
MRRLNLTGLGWEAEGPRSEPQCPKTCKGPAMNWQPIQGWTCLRLHVHNLRDHKRPRVQQDMVHGTVEQIHMPVYHPTPSQARLATQLTEEEQVRIAQRIGLIQHLPKGVYDPGRDGSEKKIRECVICMMDFVYGDPIRFLPCMHIYHMDCIDDWLMRSFTCPSCMEPVDAALLSSYETN